MRFLKIFIVSILFVSLGGCATKLSDKASKTTQEQVKKEIMATLEDYYKQPFKLEKFSYKYKTDYGDLSGNHPSVTYGEYSFEVKAVNNPIIIMDFKVYDGLATKESIKPLIDSFKKNQLNYLYCSSLYNYYVSAVRNKFEVKQPYTQQAEKYCDSINRTGYQTYKKIYEKKHQTS